MVEAGITTALSNDKGGDTYEVLFLGSQHLKITIDSSAGDYNSIDLGFHPVSLTADFRERGSRKKGVPGVMSSGP